MISMVKNQRKSAGKHPIKYGTETIFMITGQYFRQKAESNFFHQNM